MTTNPQENLFYFLINNFDLTTNLQYIDLIDTSIQLGLLDLGKICVGTSIKYCKKENIDILFKYLPNINKHTYKPPAFAILECTKNIDTLTYMMDKGLDITLLDSNGNNIIHHFVRCIVLSTDGFIFSSLDAKKNIKFHYLDGNDAENVNGLVNYNINFNCGYSDKYYKFIEFFMKNGIDLEYKNNDNKTPLELAFDLGYHSNWRHHSRYFGFDRIIISCTHFHLNLDNCIYNLLFEYNAKYTPSYEFFSILHRISENGLYDDEDEKGHTIYENYFDCCGDKEDSIFAFFMDNINKQDDDGNTVLHYISNKIKKNPTYDNLNDEYNFLSRFLGADETIKNNKGELPTND